MSASTPAQRTLTTARCLLAAGALVSASAIVRSSIAGTLLAWLLMLLVLTAFAWALIGRMDIVVTAQGKVIPSERSKVIAAVETGSVIALNVREGQIGRAHV